MHDPFNSTRPFVPQLSFADSAAPSTMTRTTDTRYTSFNTGFSSFERSYTYDNRTNDRRPSPAPVHVSSSYATGRDAGWRGAAAAARGGGGAASEVDSLDAPTRRRWDTADVHANATSSRYGTDERYVSISPLRYRQGGEWRQERQRQDARTEGGFRWTDREDTRRVDPNIFAGGARDGVSWRDRTGYRDEGSAADRFGVVHSTDRWRRETPQGRDHDTSRGGGGNSSRRDKRHARRRASRRKGSGSSLKSRTSSSASDSSSSSSYSDDSTYSDESTNDRRRRHRSGRRGHGGREGDADGSAAPVGAFGMGALETDLDLDAAPVIPPELLQRSQTLPFQWNRHPQHSVVLSLLQARGIYLPRYRELIEYHMSDLFLHYLTICCGGSYFIYYAPGKWPKERFFRIRNMPRDRRASNSDLIPFLSWTMHQTGVQVQDSIPLEQLVGLTATPRAASFRPFLVSPETIIGCREGRGHRARLPVDGAFTLWFYDAQTSASRSVDLLTCDGKVYDVWTKCFRGIISVNSSSVVQTPLTSTGMSVTMTQLMHIAQKANEELMAQMNVS